jgi:hypothetical protein
MLIKNISPSSITANIFFVLMAALLFSLPGRAVAFQNEVENIKDNAQSKIYLPMVVQKEDNIVIPNVPGNLGTYDKFELLFDVETSARNPSLPFDSNPPAGIPAGIGVSVDVLFTYDNWQTTIVQPAFYYQPYKHSIAGGKDHFVPDGGPKWAVRFTPQQAGEWQYRIRIQDSTGTRYNPAEGKPALTFNVSGQSSKVSTSRGFLRVSPADPRYFEFQDGTPFVGMGFNEGFETTTKVETKMKAFEANKMNFIRTWLSGAGINGSQWSGWASHHLSMDGYIPGVSLDIHNTYNGADVAYRLDNTNPCLFGDFWQKGIAVEPNTNYSIWARVKASDISGPSSSGDYGFVIKAAGWQGTDCNKSGGTFITPFIKGSTDWIEVVGSYRTGSTQQWLDFLYLALQNASGGKAYIDEVRVWKTDDPYKVNILREPNANSHMYFSQINSAQWDKFIQYAEDHGVYLKLVIDEKNEWIRNRISSDGTMVEKAGNDKFYAAPGTKARWLQEAWWRYLIARWGYSTAIHSFEYVNEGDPYDGRHHEAANTMARYFKEHDPSRHMVTTSFWAAFPNKEVWLNPKYSDIAYADIHAYISTGWGLYPNHWSPERRETRSEYIRSGNGSAIIKANDSFSERIWVRGMMIQGKGEWIVRYWMKAENFAASCSSGSSGGMQRVRWELDGGAKEGVVPANIQGSTSICTSPGGSYDWRMFRSDQDKDGAAVVESTRLILTDDLPHEFWIGIENSSGSGGTAWIDDIELVSPWGQVQRVVGDFDLTPMDDDTAWYNYAYGNVWGGRSLLGARKPLVRGETGIDFPDRQDWNRDLTKDTNGIWLHNNIWGQVNAGGMYELMWWSTETIPESIYYHFRNFRNFMEDIPLSNGKYFEAATNTSNRSLRAWGQRDDSSGRMHIWIQNTQHTWKRVVNGDSISAVGGSITILNVPQGQYRVDWWDPYKTSDPIFRTDTVQANGSLKLDLPFELSKDLAVKITRQP